MPVERRLVATVVLVPDIREDEHLVADLELEAHRRIIENDARTDVPYIDPELQDAEAELASPSVGTDGELLEDASGYRIRSQDAGVLAPLDERPSGYASTEVLACLVSDHDANLFVERIDGHHGIDASMTLEGVLGRGAQHARVVADLLTFTVRVHTVDLAVAIVVDEIVTDFVTRRLRRRRSRRCSRGWRRGRSGSGCRTRSIEVAVECNRRCTVVGAAVVRNVPVTSMRSADLGRDRFRAGVGDPPLRLDARPVGYIGIALRHIALDELGAVATGNRIDVVDAIQIPVGQNGSIGKDVPDDPMLVARLVV